MTFLSIFGLLALGSGAVGTYASVNSVVDSRMKEIGVRLSVGGTPGNILSMMIGVGLYPVMMGMALGVIAALILARSVSGCCLVLHRQMLLDY